MPVLSSHKPRCCARCAVLQGEVPIDTESATELAAVLRPADPQLAEAFATTAIAPRAAMLCLLHEWASAAAAAEAAAGGGGSAAAAEAARDMWTQLLRLALEDTELSSNKYLLMGATHRRKVCLAAGREGCACGWGGWRWWWGDGVVALLPGHRKQGAGRLHWWGRTLWRGFGAG